MKKLIVCICAALASITASAQITWDAEVGLNMAKISNFMESNKPGISLGVRGTMYLPTIAPGVYGNAGLFFSQKGGKLDMGDLLNIKTNATYLEVPVHIGYMHEANENFSLFGEVGPYFAYGIMGKSNGSVLDWDDDMNLTKDNSDVDTFSEGGLKKFDAGLGFRIGAEIKKKFIVAVGYNFGLVNTVESKMYSDSNDNDKFDDGDVDLAGSNSKNSNFYISVGLKF